jgi:hypothetical protein
VLPGPVDPNILSLLTERGYDQAPVYDPGSRYCWGLVDKTYLQGLFDAGQPLRSDDPHVHDERWEFRVGSFVTVFGLLAKMSKQRAVIVIRESDDPGYGRHESIWGLFTISDLNRHAVRSAIVLTGEPPMLRLLLVSQLYRGLPLGAPPPPTVHLGKALDVQSPTVAAPTTVSVSLNLSTPPYGAALCALPRWWSEWEAALHLPMDWRATPAGSTRGQNPRPECQP